MDLTPIKVKIGLRADKHVDHPDWRTLPMISSKESAEAKRDEVVRNAPLGWMYDKACGHGEERTGAGAWNSPKEMQWGCLLVTEKFANEAIAAFPALVTKITEVEFQPFYDNFANPPGVEHNAEELQALKAEHGLRVILRQDTTALENEIAGVLREIDRLTAKKWAGFKSERDIVIK